MKTEQDSSMRYNGAVDTNNMRIGYGEEVFINNNEDEIYQGQYYRDTFHGQGAYFTKYVFQDPWAYEGAFYANMKHGFGMMSFADNTYFIGQFKDDIAFGPGMWVDKVGGQNIGFWDGTSLIRLIYPVGKLEELSTDKYNKFKVLRYRKIVDVNPEIIDPAEQQINRLQTTTNLTITPDDLLSIFCKDNKSHLFLRKSYDAASTSDLIAAKDVFNLIQSGPIQNMEDLRVRLEESYLHMDNRESKAEVKISESKVKKKSKKFTRKKKRRAKKTPTELILLPQASYVDEVNEEEETQEKKQSSFSSPAETSFDSQLTYRRDNLFDRDSNFDKIKSLHLIAWNNSKTMIDMLAHSFKNRNSQSPSPLNFGLIMRGNRNRFHGRKGYLEIMGNKLLEACSSGDINAVKELVYTWNLDVNLSDSKGNSCLLRAVAKDNHDLIRLLILFGADPDIVNDEGFSTITHTLARYLTVKRNIQDWGNAFLPPTRVPNDEYLNQWMYEGKASVNLKDLAKRMRIKNYLEARPEYVFNFKPLPELDPWEDILMYLKRNKRIGKPYSAGEKQEGKSSEKIKKLLKKTSKKKKNLTGKSSKRNNLHSERKAVTRSRLFHQELLPPTTVESPPKTQKIHLRRKFGTILPDTESQLLDAKLNEIEETIYLLMKVGGNINISEVPAPPILLSLLTGMTEILETLLKQGADPNGRLINEGSGNLTTMHILALSPPLSTYPNILRLLINYGADANLCTAEDFDEDGQKFLLNGMGKSDEHPLSDKGFTPLQLLCFRSDALYVDDKEILDEMLRVLIPVSGHSFSNEQRYLGHSPLSLAITRANHAFVKTMLSIPKLVNPNEDLGEDLRNPLAVLLMYKGISPLRAAYDIIVDLLIAGANPLRLIKFEDESIGNLFDFARKLEKKLVAQFFEEMMQKPKSKELKVKRNKRKRKKGKKLLTGAKKRGLSEEHQLKYAEFQCKLSILENEARLKVGNRVRAILLKKLIDAIQNDDAQTPAINSLLVLKTRLWYTPEAFVENARKAFNLGYLCFNKMDIITAVDLLFPPNKSRTNETLESKKKIKRKLNQIMRSKSSSLLQNPEIENRLLKLDVIYQLDDIIRKCAELEVTKVVKDPAKQLGFKSKICYNLKPKSKNFDLHPELDPSDEMYTVCYNCLEKDVPLFPCPRCRMVYFCSEFCNIMDVLNEGSNYHQCRLKYYGKEQRGVMNEKEIKRSRIKVYNDFLGPIWRRADLDVNKLLQLNEEGFSLDRSIYLRLNAPMEERRRLARDQIELEREMYKKKLEEMQARLLAEEEERLRWELELEEKMMQQQELEEMQRNLEAMALAEEAAKREEEMEFMIQRIASGSLTEDDKIGGLIDILEGLKEREPTVSEISPQEMEMKRFSLDQEEFLRALGADTLDDEQRKKSFDDEQRKKSFDDEQRKKSFDDEQRKKSFDDEQRKKSFDDEQRKKSFDDEQRKKSFDDEQRRKSFDYEQRKKSLDDEQRKISFDDEQRRKSFDDEQRKKSLDDEQRKKSLDDEQRKKSLGKDVREEHLVGDEYKRKHSSMTQPSKLSRDAAVAGQMEIEKPRTLEAEKKITEEKRSKEKSSAKSKDKQLKSEPSTGKSAKKPKSSESKTFTTVLPEVIPTGKIRKEVKRQRRKIKAVTKKLKQSLRIPYKPPAEEEMEKEHHATEEDIIPTLELEDTMVSSGLKKHEDELYERFLQKQAMCSATYRYGTDMFDSSHKGGIIRVGEKMIKPLKGFVYKPFKLLAGDMEEQQVIEEARPAPEKVVNIIYGRPVPWFDTMTRKEMPKQRFTSRSAYGAPYLVDHMTGKPKRFVTWDETQSRGGDLAYPKGWAYIDVAPHERKQPPVREAGEEYQLYRPFPFGISPRGQFEWGQEPIKTEIVGVPLHIQNLLYKMTSYFGPDADLSELFPFMVIRNGELYYKFFGTPIQIENYSFN